MPPSWFLLQNIYLHLSLLSKIGKAEVAEYAKNATKIRNRTSRKQGKDRVLSLVVTPLTQLTVQKCRSAADYVLIVAVRL